MTHNRGVEGQAESGWAMTGVAFAAAMLLMISAFQAIARQTWAGVVALFLVVLSAIDNFFFIPYAPFWSLLLIALDVWVIWALTRPGAIRT